MKRKFPLFVFCFLFLAPSLTHATPMTSSKKGVGLAVYSPPGSPKPFCDSNDPADPCILKAKRAFQDMGITWFYNWTLGGENSFNWFGNEFEFVPMIFGSGTATGKKYQTWELGWYADTARNHPGSYWLIWNEPERYDMANLTAREGAWIYKNLRETIKAADPYAKLIVGNFAYMNTSWIVSFRNEYLGFYGSYPEVEGWGFHHYMCGDYSLQTWRNSFTNLKTSLDAIGQGNKQFWLTEFGCLQSDSINAQIIQDQQLEWLENQSWINRYAWYSAGGGFSGNLFSAHPNAANFGLSSLGNLYSQHPTNGIVSTPTPTSLPTSTPTPTPLTNKGWNKLALTTSYASSSFLACTITENRTSFWRSFVIGQLQNKTYYLQCR